MPRCTVCNHPQHLEINQAILSGDFILADLSRKYGLSSSAPGRHKNHIEVTMSRTRRRFQEIREQGSVFLLNDILEQVRRNLAAAELAAYLAEFPPYARPAQGPQPDPPSGSQPQIPATENSITSPSSPAPRPPEPPPHTFPGSGPGRPPNFGNPGLFRQIKGTFC